MSDHFYTEKALQEEEALKARCSMRRNYRILVKYFSDTEEWDDIKWGFKMGLEAGSFFAYQVNHQKMMNQYKGSK